MTSVTAFAPGSVAVVTGAASGIGLAASLRFAALGMMVVLADLPGERLDAALRQLEGIGEGHAMPVDVADLASVCDLERNVRARWGRVSVLMANAGIQPGSQMFGPDENWNRVIAVNLLGVIYSARTFAKEMIVGDHPGAVIVTGSKQGITTPPGDPAYNVAKAGVKAFAEALQHELRNTPGAKIQAHLLIPGFVWTPLTFNGRTEKPAGAWTADQTVAFMMDSIAAGDFYILCPDNDVNRPLDERRIAWAIGDLIENRPPLSRWHPDFASRFAAFAKS